MPIRKKGNIEVKTSPNGSGIKRTGYTFYSYDKNSAALYFEFNDQNGQPTDLKKATVRLVMILNDDDRKNASPVMTKAEIISGLRGTAKYDIPESLLSYEGKVTGCVYLEFEDGSHTDEGRFIFNIKRSMISDVLPEVGDKYVQDFEDVKERVEQAGDSATKDIEKSKDNAESQIGDYVGEVESAKNDAESQIGDYVGEVESAKGSTIEDIDKALPEVEDKLQEISGKVNEWDISDTNLLAGTSDEWKIYTWHKSYGSEYSRYEIDELGLQPGDQIVFSKELDNRLDDTEIPVRTTIQFRDKNDKVIGNIYTSKIKSGQCGAVEGKGKIIKGTKEILVFKANKEDNVNKKKAAGRRDKLQKGDYATDWTPNPSEIVTQDQYDKLANAIINLGGSI